MTDPALRSDELASLGRKPFSRAWRRIAIALIAALAVWTFVFKALAKMPDFEVYWRAGARVAAAEPLYRASDGHYVFKYLPAFAMLVTPTGLLPLNVAKAVWFLLSVVLLLLLIDFSVRILPERRRPYWLLVAILVLALGKFFAREVVLGQANLLMAVAAVGAILAMKAKRELLAGALLVLAIVVKPYAVILLPWLLARRQLHSIGAAASGLVIVLAAPAVLYGWEGNLALHREWWAMVTATTQPNLLNLDNVSFAAAFARIVGPGALAAALAFAGSAALLAAAGTVYAARRGLPFPEALEGAMLLTAIPLLSPQGWDYMFLLAAPALACLANYFDLLAGPLRVLAVAAVAVAGLTFFDVLGRDAYRAFMDLSIVTWCYACVILALAALRAGKTA